MVMYGCVLQEGEEEEEEEEEDTYTQTDRQTRIHHHHYHHRVLFPALIALDRQSQPTHSHVQDSPAFRPV